MAFDLGFDFRATSGFVTDPSYAAPVLAEAYPHTYTNGDGYSINAGWSGGSGAFTANRSTGVDVRLAGVNYALATETITFQVDLASGSAPGAGDYTIDMASGDSGGAHAYAFTVQDNTTTLISWAKALVFSGHFVDATATDRTPGTSSWDLVAVRASKTFATTTCKVNLISDDSANPVLAHFRLTLQAAGASSKQLISSLMLLGVGM